MKERLLLEIQPDWPAAVAFISDSTLVVGRLDGSLALYDAKNGKVLKVVEDKDDKQDDDN